MIDPDQIQSGQDLAEQLSALYGEGGWSMHRLAEASGLSPATIQKMINGPGVPQARTLEAFVAACKQPAAPWLRARDRAVKNRGSAKPSVADLQEQLADARAQIRRAKAALHLNGGTPEQILKSHARQRLEQFAAQDPLIDPQNGHLYLVVHPATGAEDALVDLFTQRPEYQLDPIIRSIVRDRGHAEFSPDLDRGVWERRSTGCALVNGVDRETGAIREERFLETSVHEDGSVTLLCGAGSISTVSGWRHVSDVINEAPQYRVVSPWLVLGLTYGALALAGTLADTHASYQGDWLVGLRVTGLSGGAWAYEVVKRGDQDVVPPYNGSHYERIAVCETSDLLTPAALTEKLAGSLIRGLSIHSLVLPYPRTDT
ncbi:helix-turn-helix domain-containing protein [Actinomadura sp. 3N508]|uniref:helix-turn-helix domain-containing protein n=1 Tax=Actinomadura sp. 3N508 TaxID=3375153 RepID=UPI00379D6D3F